MTNPQIGIHVRELNLRRMLCLSEYVCERLKHVTYNCINIFIQDDNNFKSTIPLFECQNLAPIDKFNFQYFGTFEILGSIVHTQRAVGKFRCSLRVRGEDTPGFAEVEGQLESLTTDIPLVEYEANKEASYVKFSSSAAKIIFSGSVLFFYDLTTRTRLNSHPAIFDRLYQRPDIIGECPIFVTFISQESALQEMRESENNCSQLPFPALPQAVRCEIIRRRRPVMTKNNNNQNNNRRDSRGDDGDDGYPRRNNFRAGNRGAGDGLIRSQSAMEEHDRMRMLRGAGVGGSAFQRQSGGNDNNDNDNDDGDDRRDAPGARIAVGVAGGGEDVAGEDTARAGIPNDALPSQTRSQPQGQSQSRVPPAPAPAQASSPVPVLAQVPQPMSSSQTQVSHQQVPQQQFQPQQQSSQQHVPQHLGIQQSDSINPDIQIQQQHLNNQRQLNSGTRSVPLEGHDQSLGQPGGVHRADPGAPGQQGQSPSVVQESIPGQQQRASPVGGLRNMSPHSVGNIADSQAARSQAAGSHSSLASQTLSHSSSIHNSEELNIPDTFQYSQGSTTSRIENNERGGSFLRNSTRIEQQHGDMERDRGVRAQPAGESGHRGGSAVSLQPNLSQPPPGYETLTFGNVSRVGSNQTNSYTPPFRNITGNSALQENAGSVRGVTERGNHEVQQGTGRGGGPVYLRQRQDVPGGGPPATAGGESQFSRQQNHEQSNISLRGRGASIRGYRPGSESAVRGSEMDQSRRYENYSQALDPSDGRNSNRSEGQISHHSQSKNQSRPHSVVDQNVRETSQVPSRHDSQDVVSGIVPTDNAVLPPTDGSGGRFSSRQEQVDSRGQRTGAEDRTGSDRSEPAERELDNIDSQSNSRAGKAGRRNARGGQTSYRQQEDRVENQDYSGSITARSPGNQTLRSSPGGKASHPDSLTSRDRRSQTSQWQSHDGQNQESIKTSSHPDRLGISDESSRHPTQGRGVRGAADRSEQGKGRTSTTSSGSGKGERNQEGSRIEQSSQSKKKNKPKNKSRNNDNDKTVVTSKTNTLNNEGDANDADGEDNMYSPDHESTLNRENEEDESKEYSPGKVPDDAPHYTPSPAHSLASSSTRNVDQDRERQNLPNILSSSDSERERIRGEMNESGVTEITYDIYERIMELSEDVRRIFSQNLSNHTTNERTILEFGAARHAILNLESELGRQNLGINLSLAMSKVIRELLRSIDKVRSSVEAKMTEAAEAERERLIREEHSRRVQESRSHFELERGSLRRQAVTQSLLSQHSILSQHQSSHLSPQPEKQPRLQQQHLQEQQQQHQQQQFDTPSTLRQHPAATAGSPGMMSQAAGLSPQFRNESLKWDDTGMTQSQAQAFTSTSGVTESGVNPFGDQMFSFQDTVLPPQQLVYTAQSTDQTSSHRMRGGTIRSPTDSIHLSEFQGILPSDNDCDLETFDNNDVSLLATRHIRTEVDNTRRASIADELAGITLDTGNSHEIQMIPSPLVQVIQEDDNVFPPDVRGISGVFVSTPNPDSVSPLSNQQSSLGESVTTSQPPVSGSLVAVTRGQTDASQNLLQPGSPRPGEAAGADGGAQESTSDNPSGTVMCVNFC